MNVHNIASGAVAAAALLLFNSAANAVVCNDPLGAGETRQIEVLVTSGTAVASCLSSGTGNPGNNDFPNFIEKDEADSNGGYLDVTGIPNNGPGTWSVSGLLGPYAILFKFGGAGEESPDWWLVGFTGGNASGSWAWESGKPNGLSHASLYGVPGQQVPEPAILGLLGLGLVGLGFARRRKA